MALNTLDMVQVAAIFAGILVLFALIGGRWAVSWVRLKENKLRWEVEERVKGFRAEAQEAIGGAIGRFMQNLAQQAAEEEGDSSSGSSTGAFELGGFKIDPALIQAVVEYGPQLIKLAQSFGFLKGTGGAGTQNPFLK